MTEQDNGLAAKDGKVYDLISKNTFEVPWHQREYVWTTKEVELFWQDLQSASNQMEDTYFIGPLVLTQTPTGIYKVQDGQQRLVTYSLLCEALRQASNQNNDPEAPAHNELVRQLIFNGLGHRPKDEDIESAPPRITPPQKNKLLYDAIVRGHSPEPNGNLQQAWTYLQKRAAALTPGQREAFLTFALNGVITVYITVNPSKATQIFEAINARGTPLQQVDLVLNHFYSHFEENDSEAEAIHENLDRMRNQFRGRYAVNRLEKYVRCYMQCRYGHLSETTLYREIKEKISAELTDATAQEKGEYIQDLVQDMTSWQNLKTYDAIYKADIDGELITKFCEQTQGSQQPRTIQDFIYDLKLYGVTHPLLFAVMSQYQKETTNARRRQKAHLGIQIARALDNLVMRIAMTSPKFAPDLVEHSITNQAHVIFKTLDRQTTNDCIAALNATNPATNWTTEEFKSHLALSVNNPDNRSKRLLIPIYRFHQPDLPINTFIRMTVEHILPESYEDISGWPNFDETSRQTYKNHIGNLTLLTSKQNRGDNFNKSFDAKRDTFAQSSLKENKNIAAYSDWSPQSIEDRGKELMDTLCQIWSG